MMYIILLVSLVVFFTAGSITGVKQTRRLLRAEIGERARIQHYATATFSLWIPVAALCLVVAFTDITFANIGFTRLSFDMNTAVTVIVLGLAAVWTAYLLCKIAAFLVSPKYRRKRSNAFRKKAKSGDYYDAVLYRLMIPRTRKEKVWWLWASLASGICEEVIFRGTFIFLIARIFPDISMYLVFVLAVILFGLGHFYQGRKGLILTTLAGAFFVALYIVSGSLILPIAIHFLTNFANAFEYSAEPFGR